MTVSIIAAITANRTIGLAGDMPWRLPDDLRRFKALTTGHTVVMGRRTFESIGRPLPNRTNIVITRNADFSADGITIVGNLEAAIRAAGDDDEVFIIGGGEVYGQAIPLADRLYITTIHATIEGDTFFPEFDDSNWRLVENERHEPDDRHEHAFSFRLYERIPPTTG